MWTASQLFRRGEGAGRAVVGCGLAFALYGLPADAQPTARADPYLFHDAHVHLTNYIQEGVDVRGLLKASNDTRDLAYSATVWWMPTTGEFGQRGGLADFEERTTVATRFGLSAGRRARTGRTSWGWRRMRHSSASRTVCSFSKTARWVTG